MTPLRVLAVDDEVLALRRLRLMLQAMPYVEQVGEADGVRDALAKIESLAPDVLLLDIRMRDGSGFDLVQALARRATAPAIVFVSAFNRFAVRAFETSAVDYLLKPIERDRLGKALQRARERRGEADAVQRVAELQEIIGNLRAAAADEGDPAYEPEFWVRKGNALVKVPVDSIEWVASEDEYVRLNTATDSYLMRGSIRQLESRLDPARFVRIHRRWLVRKAAIVELRAVGLGRVEAVLRSGKHFKAGRVYGRRLREMVLQAAADAEGAAR